MYYTKAAIVSIASFLCSLLAAAQPDFNKTYDFDGPGLWFVNLLADNDTLVLYGFGQDTSSPPKQGLYFVRMDSLGNVINSVFHADTTGGYFFLDYGFDIIRLSDGRYGGVGGLSGARTFLAVFGRTGEMEMLKTMNDPTVLFTSLRKVIELDDGFLLGGYKQKQNFSLDMFILKTDKLGNKLWEKSYGASNENDFLGTLTRLDDNTYVIGASRQKTSNLPLNQFWARSRILAIDSLGTIKWDWSSALNKGGGIRGLHQTEDGGWIYCTGEFDVNLVENWLDTRPKIVMRDSSMNLVWEEVMEVGKVYLNSFMDMKPSPDGYWVGAGFWTLPFDDVTNAELYGGLCKISPAGEVCWLRTDSSEWSIGAGKAANYYGGLAMLSSGSIVAAGRSERLLPSPSKDFAWVVKVDQGGNTNTLCLFSNAEELMGGRQLPTVTAYPNPANDHIVFTLSGTLVEDDPYLVLFNPAGQRIANISFGSTQSTTLDTASLPTGLYFYRLTLKTGASFSGKIIIQH